MNGQKTYQYNAQADRRATGMEMEKHAMNTETGSALPAPVSTPMIEPWSRRYVEGKRYRKMFIVPFILLIISVLITGASNYPDPPYEDDYEDNYDKWQREKRDFDDIIGDIQNTADMFFTVGILVLSFLFFMGAFVDKELPVSIKIVMMVLGVAIISLFLADGIKLQAIFG